MLHHKSRLYALNLALGLSLCAAISMAASEIVRLDFDEVSSVAAEVLADKDLESLPFYQITTNGIRHFVDRSDEKGSIVASRRYWGADPEQGASVKARVKSLHCTYPGGVALLVSDGVHEELMTIYPDHVELWNAKKSFDLDGSQYHEYQIEIKNEDIKLSIDGEPVYDGSGQFTHPAVDGRNYITFGAASSRALSDSYWDWVEYTRSDDAEQASGYPYAKHSEVFHQEGVHARAPALHNHMDTGHPYVRFVAQVARRHGGGRAWLVCTSEDGGTTWKQVESIPASRCKPVLAECRYNLHGGSVIGIGSYGDRWHPDNKLDQFADKYWIRRDPSIPDRFSIRTGGYLEYASKKIDDEDDLKRTDIPELDLYKACSSKRAHTRLVDGTIMRAFTVMQDPVDNGRVLAVMTRDGKTAQVVPVVKAWDLNASAETWLGEECLAHGMTDGGVWVMVQTEGEEEGIYQAISHDQGQSWTSRETGIEGRLPGHVLRLEDGRLVLTYVHDREPYGIRAVLSGDEGRTWDTANTVVLRNDSASAAVGAPSSMLLPDGKILTVYYITGEDGYMYIAATQWPPPHSPKVH